MIYLRRIYFISATVPQAPVRVSKVYSGLLVCWSAGLLVSGLLVAGLLVWICLLIGSWRGFPCAYPHLLAPTSVTIFSCFFSPVFRPSKIHLWSQLGANMVPKWPQIELFWSHFHDFLMTWRKCENGALAAVPARFSRFGGVKCHHFFDVFSGIDSRHAF